MDELEHEIYSQTVVSRIITPQKCLCPNPQNLLVCYLYSKGTLQV